MNYFRSSQRDARLRAPACGGERRGGGVYSLGRAGCVGSRGGEGDRCRRGGASDSEELDPDLLLLAAPSSREDGASRPGEDDFDRDRELLPLEYEEGDSDRLFLLNLFPLPSSPTSLSSPSEEELEPLPLEEYVSTLSLRLLFPLSSSFSFNTISATPDLRQLPLPTHRKHTSPITYSVLHQYSI